MVETVGRYDQTVLHQLGYRSLVPSVQSAFGKNFTFTGGGTEIHPRSNSDGHDNEKVAGNSRTVGTFLLIT